MSLLSIPIYAGVRGVNYIKISKIDEQGTDNTLSLQQLTHIRIKFDDLGIVDFPIVSITDYNTYYLYTIDTVNFGYFSSLANSPTNPNTTPTTYTLTSGNNTSPIFSGYTNTTGSIGSNGLYSFKYGGLPVTVSCSLLVRATATTSDSVSVLFTGSEGIVRRQRFYLNAGSPSSTLITASYTYTPSSGSSIGLAIATGSVNITADLSDIYFKVIQDVTSSIDNNILDHHISASKTTSTNAPTGQSYANPNQTLGNLAVSNWTTEHVDALNYFNTTSGIITFGDTPNVPIQLTASTQVTAVGTGNAISFFSTQTGYFSTLNITSTGTYTISASITPIENEKIGFIIYKSLGTLTYQNCSLIVTQSEAPYSESKLTVLEPYLTQDFQYNDCNSLLNNAELPEYSNVFMKVNYETGQFIPTNQEEIINFTAESAPVKAYNYRLLSQILPRYNGVRTTQQNENVWTDGDIGYGKYPTVQTPSTYIAYFEWIGGTTPEWIGKSATYIKYLIDVDGNAYSPSFSSSYYYNLIDNFETNKNVLLSLNTSQGASTYQTIGSIPVLRAGALPMPILASQTGSGLNIQNAITFQGIPGITNYSASFENTSVQTIGNNISVVTFPISTIANSNITNNTSYITINATSNNVLIALQFNPGTVETQPTTTQYPYSSITATVIFDKYVGGAWTFLYSYDVPLYTDDVLGTNVLQTIDPVTTPFFSPISGDQYRVRMTSNTGYYDVAITAELNIIQTPLPAPQLLSSSGFFTTGSLSKNILTGSDFSNVIYNPFSPATQASLSGSGYFPFLPFVIKNGDQIRFEGDELQVYNIIKAEPKTPTVPFHIILDKNIVDGTNINSFLIRRLDPNPNFVTLHYNNTASAAGSGFLIPEFPSKQLSDNFDKILQSLKDKNLIPT